MEQIWSTHPRQTSAAFAVLDDEERIQPVQRDGVKVEQVAGQGREPVSGGTAPMPV
jgi:hypothetical protein